MYSHLILYRRQCWVCFGTDTDEPDSEWTSPCHCRGGMKWVHQSCLQKWVDEKQKMSSSIKVTCPQCRFTYKIQYPSANVILLLYEHMERFLTLSSPMLLASLTAATLYWSSFTYGVTAVTLALGREQAGEFFSSPDSALVVVCLPLLPWIIFALKLIRPEVLVLRFWYRVVVPILYHIFKGFSATTHMVVSLPVNRSFRPAEIHPLHYVSRCAFSTVMFPIVSTILGNLLFISAKSGLKRTVLVSYI